MNDQPKSRERQLLVACNVVLSTVIEMCVKMLQICRHNEELVNQVANAGVLTSAVQLLTDKMTSAVRRNSSGLLLQASGCCVQSEDHAQVQIKCSSC